MNAVELRKAKARGLLFSNFEAMKRVAKQMGQTKHITWLVLHIVVLFFITFAIAGTTIWYNTEQGKVDFVIALDVSSSMSVTDIQPTRLQAAKEAAKTFVDLLRDNQIESNIAIVVFSGVALEHHDFTFDYNEVKNAIDSVYISEIPGTAIGNAIITSASILEARTNLKSIILLTDGQSNVGLDVDKALSYANDRHIVINTIGIDEVTLKNIAGTTGGKYFYVTDENEFSRAFEDLAKAPEGKIGVKLAPYFLIGVIVLFFFEWILVLTKYRVIP
jgi:Ca-activated chloride channel family protein